MCAGSRRTSCRRGSSYVATTSLLDGALDRQLQRDSGMPMAYYLILAMLSDVPGRTLRMSDLAAVTQSSQSRLSHAVSKLERNGWVRRTPCPDDRRSTLAQLTDAGSPRSRTAAPGHVRAVRRHVFDRLSPEQVGQLREIFATVLEGLTGARRLCRRTDAGRVTPMGTLVLLRHGQSVWNAENLFTGWVDVPLSETGEQEARRGGELLRAAGLLPDVVHTSLLRRAISTANLALDACDRHWIPVRRDWRLNERHYGALQGKDKKQTLEEFGEEQFMLWRRSYDVPPPPIEPGSEFSQDGDPRYAGPRRRHAAPPSASPTSSSGSCPTGSPRSCPTCAPARSCCSPRTATRCARSSSTSTASPTTAIAGLNIPTGIPLRYDLDDDLRPTVPGRHLPRPGGREGRPPPRWPPRAADAGGSLARPIPR